MYILTHTHTLGSDTPSVSPCSEAGRMECCQSVALTSRDSASHTGPDNLLLFPLPHSPEEVLPAQLMSPHSPLPPQLFLHHSLKWDGEKMRASQLLHIKTALSIKQRRGATRPTCVAIPA